MKKIAAYIRIGSFFLVFSLVAAGAAYAQSTDGTGVLPVQEAVQTTASVGGDSAPAAGAPDALEGMTIDTSNTVPSAFGLWWRGIRERISLSVTRDPVQKAQKQLQFAEERLQIAKTIAEKSTDPNVQAKAEAMVTKANEFLQKIEEKKDAWAKKSDEQSLRLLKNIAAHELRREDVMDRLEETLPEDVAQKIQEQRAEAAERGQRLLNAIHTADMPAAIREHVQNVKDRIEAHAAEVRAFQKKAEELRAKAQAGDTGAQIELQSLRQERKEQVKDRAQERQDAAQERKAMLDNRAKEGDPRAVQKLNTLNTVEAAIQRSRMERADVRDGAKVQIQAAQDAAAKKDIRTDARQTLGEMRKEARQEVKDGRQNLISNSAQGQ